MYFTLYSTIKLSLLQLLRHSQYDKLGGVRRVRDVKNIREVIGVRRVRDVKNFREVIGVRRGREVTKF